jgi:hypothetical protein
MARMDDIASWSVVLGALGYSLAALTWIPKRRCGNDAFGTDGRVNRSVLLSPLMGSPFWVQQSRCII